METAKSKECTKCHKIYPETKDYFKTYFRAGKQHLTAQCKFCYNDYNKKYRKEHPEVFLKSGRKFDNSPKGIYKKLKYSIRGHKVKISEKSFVEWYLSQPRKCYYCGLREEDMHKVKDAYNNKVNRLTIDRTDSSKGYEEGEYGSLLLAVQSYKGRLFYSIGDGENWENIYSKEVEKCTLSSILEAEVENKYFLSEAQMRKIVFGPRGGTEALDTAGDGGREMHTAIPMTLAGHTISEKEISPCLNANDSRKVFGCGQPHAAVGQMFAIDKNVQGTELECANALTAKEDRGVSNFKQTGTAIAVTVGFVNPEKDGSCRTLKAQMAKNSLANFVRTDSLGATAVSVAIPVLTPERAEKRQNGRRFKDNGEEAFTLTAQDRHGVAISGVNGVPVIWYEKYNCYIAIRKLTPKECFRLQGWTDDYFEKAQFVNSDSQLYKQAGNGVTVNVVEDIARAIGECE